LKSFVKKEIMQKIYNDIWDFNINSTHSKRQKHKKSEKLFLITFSTGYYVVMTTSIKKAKEFVIENLLESWLNECKLRRSYFNKNPKQYQKAISKYHAKIAEISRANPIVIQKNKAKFIPTNNY
jgi:hypothetical protein